MLTIITTYGGIIKTLKGNQKIWDEEIIHAVTKKRRSQKRRR